MSDLNPTPEHETTPPPAVPRQAATVILLRQPGDDVEVLVIRRHENLAFMGGLWVFPGGTLARADSLPQVLARIPPDARQRCERFLDVQGEPLPQEQCLGLTVAAHRETFEETGVLLARRADGRDCEPDLLAAIQARRAAIAERPELFAALLEEQHLVLDIERLVYWAHWITPGSAPRRFDTRFFIAAMSSQQKATIDAVEAVEHAWMRPATLVEAAHEGKLPLSPPTLFNLMELAAELRRHGSLDALLSAAARRTISPVLPKLVREGHARTIVMPWDAAYDSLPGTGVPAGLNYPDALRNLPSRTSEARRA